jgi:hypothetical protein
VEKSAALAAVLAARRVGGGERFIHDAPDRPRATPALGAATETMIDLAGRARHFRASGQGRAHIVIGKYVAGADDHRNRPGDKLVLSETFNSVTGERLQR